MASVNLSLVPYNGPLLATKDNFKPTKRPQKAVSRLQSRDTLSCITSFLDVPSVVSMSKTCKDFHGVKEISVRGNSAIVSKLLQSKKGDWKKLHAKDKALLRSVGSTIHSLTLSDINLKPEKLKKLIKIFPNIQHVSFKKCSLTDETLQVLATLKDKLISLTLKFKFKDLLDDHVTCDKGLKLLGTFTQLRNLWLLKVDLTNAELFSSLSNLTQLRRLTLQAPEEEDNNDQITPQIIKLFASKMPHLKELTIDEWWIESDAISKLHKFTQLECLQVTGRAGKVKKELVEKLAVKLPNLKKVKFDKSSVKNIGGKEFLEKTLPQVKVKIRDN